MRLFLLLLIPLKAAFCQADEELLKKVRQNYYALQKEIPSMNKIVLNDSITYYIKDSSVVKIDFHKGQINEELYYYKDSDYPYFIFSRSDHKENRYYFESDDRNSFRMFKWTGHDKKDRSIESSDFKFKNQAYLIKGRNLKIICENKKMSPEKIQQIKYLLDSLKSLHYDTVRGNPFYDLEDTGSSEIALSGTTRFELTSKDKKIELLIELSWYDCAGGGSDERYFYRLPDNATIEEVNYNREPFGEYKFACKGNSIYYNDGKNNCISIDLMNNYKIDFVEEWKKEVCR